MASGDTKTNQYLDVAANGTRADLPSDTCCETRSQTLIREVAERIMDVEDEVERLENNPDVVDIVDTYEDLEDYDTSTLTDKDIIRVLNDETHDGESTYYRYDKQSNTFTYIGSAGGSGGSGIPTDATFWGQSYDSANNVVKGNIILPATDGSIKPHTQATSYIGFDGGEDPLLVSGGTRITLRNPSQSDKVLEIRGGAVGKYIQFYATYPSGTLGVKGITDPTDPQDAATKNYVDTQVGNIATILQTLNSGTGAN